jgi:hypothetical protein
MEPRLLYLNLLAPGMFSRSLYRRGSLFLTSSTTERPRAASRKVT